MIKKILFKERLLVSVSMLFVILIIFVASTANVKSEGLGIVSNYSSMGSVSSISPSLLSLTDQKGTHDFDISEVAKIESKNYTQLSVNDIHEGDMIIVQGIKNDEDVTLRRIINLTWNGVLATTTDVVATTTTDIATTTASTTDFTIASSTESSSGTSNSTLSTELVATTTLDISTSTDSVAASTTDTIVIDTATSTDSAASSTDQTVVVPVAPEEIIPANNEEATTTPVE